MRTTYVVLLSVFLFGLGGLSGIWLGYTAGSSDSKLSFSQDIARAEAVQDQGTHIFYLGIAIGQDEASGKILSSTVDSLCEDIPFDDCLSSLQVYEDALDKAEAPKLHL